jgi:hypothetical protein
MAFTENGAASLSTTLDARLNLFFKTVRDLGVFQDAIPSHVVRQLKSAPQQPGPKKVYDYWGYSDSEDNDDLGTAVSQKNEKLYQLIDASWEVDKLDTLKILMNWRDCRGGKGDYSGFLVAMAYLWQKDPEWVEANIGVIPEYGCWLDLVKLWHISMEGKSQLMTTLVNRLETDLRLLQAGDTSGISLLAKWLPSENSKWDRFTKDRFCIALCKHLFALSYKQKVSNTHLKEMRQEYLAPLRKHLSLVESKLCEKNYGDIEYEKVPSVAMHKYKKAFSRNDRERFSQYLAKVAAGKSKINSSQVYPHDLVRGYMNRSSYTEDPVVEAQWKEIKKKVVESGAFERSIAVVDVSGSMSGTPMEVAIALGLLGIGEGNSNRVITFSERPQLHTIPEGSLYTQVQNIMRMEWGANTNFEKVMDLVFGMVVGGAPIYRVYIYSDMQFDKAMSMGSVVHFERIKTMFEEAGFDLPQIVFWNLRGDTGDFPVTCNESGVVMLAGYSPSLLSSIIDKDDITPLNMMFKIIRGPRYNAVVSP